MKLIAMTLISLALLSGTGRAGFLIDQSAADMRKDVAIVELRDLAIEETGLLDSTIWFCVQDGSLFIWRSAKLDHEPSEYGWNLRVTRKQGNTVSVEATAGPKSNGRQDFERDLVYKMETSCQVEGQSTDELFSVSDINGKTKWTDLRDTMK